MQEKEEQARKSRKQSLVDGEEGEDFNKQMLYVFD